MISTLIIYSKGLKFINIDSTQYYPTDYAFKYSSMDSLGTYIIKEPNRRIKMDLEQTHELGILDLQITY